VEFRALGPVELWVSGRPVNIGPVKQRTVLAALLLEPGRLVGPETLIGRVWDGSPPTEVRNVMYTYVARLRRVLERAAAESGEPIELQRQRGGYLLTLDPSRIDVHRFQTMVGQARAAGTDGERALLLQRAVGLWRGVPLGGLTGTWVSRVRERLERQRLDVLVERADVEIRLGRPAAVIEELRDVLAERPLSELVIGRLLQALYGAGRGAEALECYAIARRRIIDEVGAEPSPELRRLHEAILREALPGAPARPTGTGGAPGGGIVPDGGLDGGEVRPASPAVSRSAARPGWLSGSGTPSLLPADLMDFTGRDAQVESLCRTLSPGQRTAAPVAVLVGGGGLGKTALAVHVAQRLRDRFTDGQLFLDLKGLYPDRVDPVKALERLLRALDGRSAIPDSLAERAEWYRNLLAGRRILVVLDDAADEAQIAPLLPGAASCGVLVTSRARLAGLPCDRLHLGPLEPAEAVQLLGRIAGPDRVAADPAASREVVRLCDYLPLAVRIAGTRLVERPHWSVPRLESRLADRRQRLAELVHGTLAMRGSLDLSYRRLDPHARQLFRRLGMLEASDFAGWIAEPLLGVGTSAAEDALERLIEAHLLDVNSDDRAGRRDYHFSDLVRAYARELAEAEHEPAIGEIAAAEHPPFGGPWVAQQRRFRRRSGTT
jgi:DNA-binding SARP family transcriptional activator